MENKNSSTVGQKVDFDSIVEALHQLLGGAKIEDVLAVHKQMIGWGKDNIVELRHSSLKFKQLWDTMYEAGELTRDAVEEHSGCKGWGEEELLAAHLDKLLLEAEEIQVRLSALKEKRS